MKREKVEKEDVKKIIEKYSSEEMEISNHYLEKIGEGKRDLKPEFLKEKILTNDFYFAEKQIKDNEIRYKLIYELSNKYDLVVAVTEKIPKSLKVITSYKTSRKVKKKWQRDSKLAMKK